MAFVDWVLTVAALFFAAWLGWENGYRAGKRACERMHGRLQGIRER